MSAIAVAVTVIARDGGDAPDEPEVVGYYSYTITPVSASAVGKLIVPGSAGREVYIEDPTTVTDWTQYYRVTDLSGKALDIHPAEVHWVRVTIELQAYSRLIGSHQFLWTDGSTYESYKQTWTTGEDMVSINSSRVVELDPTATATFYVLTDGSHTELRIIDTGIHWIRVRRKRPPGAFPTSSLYNTFL